MRLLLTIVLSIYFSYGYSQKVNQTSSGSGNNIAIDKVEGDVVTGSKTINNYYLNRDSLNKKVSIDCIKKTSICFVNKYSFEIKIIGKIGTKLLDLLVLQPGEENCYYGLEPDVLKYSIQKIGTWGIPVTHSSSNILVSPCETKYVKLDK